MRSLSYRPRKEDPKKEENKETVNEAQVVETQPEVASGFDESVVIN